jgi:hypothetical protein
VSTVRAAVVIAGEFIAFALIVPGRLHRLREAEVELL